MRVEIKVTAGPVRGKTFTFEEPDCFLFGRAADARISLPDDPFVSRQHFLLEISPPDVKVSDLGSKNGLFVNDVRFGGRKPPEAGVKQAQDGATETHLKSGDQIAVGDTRMSVVVELDAVCSECGAQLPDDEEEPFLCGTCREQQASAGRQAAETMTHAPQPVKRAVACARCGKDATEEAGSRGQVKGSEYVCQACRSREKQAPPMELLQALLQAAVVRKKPTPDQRFSGYRVEGELGRGGMGVVLKAVEEKSGRPVAIKTMLPHVAVNPNAVRVFNREVEVTRQLKHPNIVELYEHGNAGGTFFFVLEFVDGVDLEQYVKSRGGRISLEEAAPIMMGVLAGLGHAHTAKLEAGIKGGKTKKFKGVVHRDLKPQNILLAREGWIAKVADFGLSKSFESAGLTDMTAPGQAAGSPMYWPREQITHYKWLNPATDVFSVAAVFYEALTGAPVRDGFQELFLNCRRRNRGPGIPDFMRTIAKHPPVPIRQRRQDVPAPVAEVIDRALRETEVPTGEDEMRATLSRLRYEDASAFRKALGKALKQAGVTP